MSKSTGSAILFLLACIAIAIFYIIAVVSYDDDGSVVGQRQQDAFSSSNNLRQLSLIDPKTVETRQGSSLRSSGVSFNDQLEQVSWDFLSAHTFITIINVLHLCHLFVKQSLLVYKECIRYTTHELLPSIIAKINEDPEDNGLKPFTIVRNSYMKLCPDKSTCSIKGLDLSIFRGKRTALLGDSTLFYPTQWLYPMMTHLNDEEENGIPKYDEMSLSEASEVVKKRAGILGVKELITDSTDNTLIQWAGVKGPGASKTLETRISGMIETVSRLNPHVLVANMGLHWLHLHPLVPKDGIVIHRWVHYNTSWLREVYNLAMDMNQTTLLLFKTTSKSLLDP